MVSKHESEKVTYTASVHGIVLSNAEVYLPFITATLKTKLQIAYNSALRAMAGLKRRGKVDIVPVRKEFSIPTVDQMTRYITIRSVWRNRFDYIQRKSLQAEQRTTRSSHLL